MGRTLIDALSRANPRFRCNRRYVRMQEEEAVPRDYWPGIVSIREVLLDDGVAEDVVEELLDEIERLIVEALRETERDTAESSQDEKGSP